MRPALDTGGVAGGHAEVTDCVVCTHGSPEPPALSVGLYQVIKGLTLSALAFHTLSQQPHEMRHRTEIIRNDALGDEMRNCSGDGGGGVFPGPWINKTGLEGRIRRLLAGAHCDHTSQSFPQSSVHSPQFSPSQPQP